MENVMVVLNMTVWSSNTMMMWEKCFSEFSTKSPTKLNATFGRSRDGILALVHKPKKSRIPDEIIALMCDKFV
ncbi:hypothetical protein HKD37_19G052617 [Glycine soja]